MNRPPFSSFPILGNHRITLREIAEPDYSHLADICFYDGVPAANALDAKAINKKIETDYENGNGVHWLITLQSTDEVLGTCEFYRGFVDDTGEIGYVLKKGYQGKGYMAEAVSLILAYGWKELALTSIIAETAPDNQASINVLKKSGFEIVETKIDGIRFRIER